jgi:hypothetical protein
MSSRLPLTIGRQVTYEVALGHDRNVLAPWMFGLDSASALRHCKFECDLRTYAEDPSVIEGDLATHKERMKRGMYGG